jgi:acyl phosphate:glycerol-3-phosphate acyltransferase
MNYLLMFLIIIIAYFYGCFSTARMVAKSFRSLNIYKVGNGMADTENIYANVSKSLGILVGAMDVLKALLFLLVVDLLLRLLNSYTTINGFSLLYNRSIMLIYGLAMLSGHCLPLTHKFRGGRGIFTYTGYLLYFAPLPMMVALVLAWLLVAIYKQIRFAQYVIVLLPVLLTHVFYTFIPIFRQDLPPHFVAIIWAIAIAMGALNFLVSKKMGEI